MTDRASGKRPGSAGIGSSRHISGQTLQSNSLPVLLFLAALAIGAVFTQRLAPPAPTETVSLNASTRFMPCDTGRRANCVVDGDTFWYGGEKIRIADIDTPELSPPRCDREKTLGEAAKRELLVQLNAGDFEIASDGRRDTDRYGRKLRTILRDGSSIGDALVAKGLARRWDGSRHGWCD